MTRITWGQPGTRQFEAGVDRGVLYLPDNSGVAWNGLTGVAIDPGDSGFEEYYLDGIKYLVRRLPTDFGGSISALTYPDEFQQFDGLGRFDFGIYVGDQSVINTFGLCYRTGLGDDLTGLSRGYRLHVLYNLTAKPETRSFSTLGSTTEAEAFTWTISGVPSQVPGMRPSVHYVIDSTEVNAGIMALYENTLYGTDTVDPVLPDATTLVQMQQMAS